MSQFSESHLGFTLKNGSKIEAISKKPKNDFKNIKTNDTEIFQL